MALKQYGELFYKESSNEWIISKIEPHVSIKLKNIFEKIKKYSIPPYKFNNHPDVCADLLWFISRYPLYISDKDMSKLKLGVKKYNNNIKTSENILNSEIVVNDHPVLKSGIKIRNYQYQIAKLLEINKVLLCGDDLGLGKTYSAIASLLNQKALPAIVVVQTHLAIQWKDKIIETTNLNVHLVNGRKPYKLPPADVYIFKYSIIGSWVDVFNTGFFKTVIFDEIQELRSGTETEKGSASNLLCQKANYKLGLSATPIYNYGHEIWNIFNILENNILGNKQEFMREWAGGTNPNDTKAIIKDPKALGSYLRERFLLIRRTKHDVGQFLEPVNKLIYNVEYDHNAVKNCMDIAKTLAIKTISGSFTERGQAARELDILMRHYTGVSKAKYVAEFVKVFLDNNEPIILAGWHRDVYEIWQKELKDYSPQLYTGTESSKEKDTSKENFITGKSNLLILSLRSGAGLDGLQHRSSIVVFGELDWSPQVHEQVTGRLYREGQKEKVMAVYLVSEFGSDPLMVNILGLKASQSDAIMNPLNTQVNRTVNDESRIQLLAKSIISKHQS